MPCPKLRLCSCKRENIAINVKYSSVSVRDARSCGYGNRVVLDAASQQQCPTLADRSASPPVPRVAADPHAVLSGRHAVAVVTEVAAFALEVVPVAAPHLAVGKSG